MKLPAPLSTIKAAVMFAKGCDLLPRRILLGRTQFRRLEALASANSLYFGKTDVNTETVFGVEFDLSHDRRGYLYAYAGSHDYQITLCGHEVTPMTPEAPPLEDLPGRLTVGRLRDLLAKLPDAAPVSIASGHLIDLTVEQMRIQNEHTAHPRFSLMFDANEFDFQREINRIWLAEWHAANPIDEEEIPF